MHRRLYAPLFLCFAAVSACESPSYINPVPTPEPPSPPVAAAEFAAAYAKASCDRFVRCDNAAPYLAEQCLQNALDFLGEDVEAAIAAGRIVYNDAEAGKCVAGIADTRCLDQEPSDETIASCLAGLQGTVAAGQPCYSPFECAAGFCPSVSKDACPALCPEVAGEGEACSFLSGPDCDVRLGLRCSVGVCVLPRGEDAACVDNQGCKSGFVCVTGVCEPLRGEDFGCARDSSCADGLFCIAEGDDGGICEKRLGEGSVCGVNPEEHLAAFRGVQCQEGLVCKGAGLNAEGTAIPGVCAKPVLAARS